MTKYYDAWGTSELIEELQRRDAIQERAREWRKDIKAYMSECEEANETDLEVLWAYVYDADATFRKLLDDGN